MNIDETLRALCEKHSLSSISIHMTPEYGPHANAHWYVGDANICVSEWGKTIAEAIASTITKANEARAVPPEVPALEMGEIAA